MEKLSVVTEKGSDLAEIVGTVKERDEGNGKKMRWGQIP